MSWPNNLREVHGVPGPVVHQLVEVICEGSFPLLGGRHVGGQALRAPLALTQPARTANGIGAVCPCGRRRGGGGGERQGATSVRFLFKPQDDNWC